MTRVRGTNRSPARRISNPPDQDRDDPPAGCRRRCRRSRQGQPVTVVRMVSREPLLSGKSVPKPSWMLSDTACSSRKSSMIGSAAGRCIDAGVTHHHRAATPWAPSAVGSPPIAQNRRTPGDVHRPAVVGIEDPLGVAVRRSSGRAGRRRSIDRHRLGHADKARNLGPAETGEPHGSHDLHRIGPVPTGRRGATAPVSPGGVGPRTHAAHPRGADADDVPLGRVGHRREIRTGPDVPLGQRVQ